MRPCEIMGHRVDYDSLNPKIRRVIEKRYGSDNFLFLRFLTGKGQDHTDSHNDSGRVAYGEDARHSDRHTDYDHSEYGDWKESAEESGIRQERNKSNYSGNTLSDPWGPSDR